MALLQMIYASQPFGFDEAMLAGILLDARRGNTRNNVTGALIVRGDLYLQLLEGPPEMVEAAYERINRDDRHTNMRQLVHRMVEERMFPNWSMLDDPAQSWVWTQDEVNNGAIEKATEDEVLGFFERLAALG